MKVMKRRGKKEFPPQTGLNRFYYPVSQRRLNGFPANGTIDPAFGIGEGSLFGENDSLGSHTGLNRNGDMPDNDADES